LEKEPGYLDICWPVLPWRRSQVTEIKAGSPWRIVRLPGYSGTDFPEEGSSYLDKSQFSL
jgi:hypothetical protein